jgi:hypothetical protein
MTTENRLLRAYGQGCARGTLLYVVIAIVVFGGFCCLSTAAALLPIDDDFRVWIWVGLIVLFMFTMIGGVVIWAIFTIRKRGKDLDEVFTPLGLEGRGYLTNGRQYHGNFHGYPMHVYFSRGPTLQIYLDVPLGTRVGIGRKSELARLASNLIERELLDLNDPEFDKLAIYPDDPRWAMDLFANPQARAAILCLTSEDSAAELRSLSITPNALLWQSRYIPLRNINTETVRTWVNDLYRLAGIAQGLTPPTVTAAESALEQTTRTDRSKYTWPAIGITCGVFAAIAACGIVIAAVTIILIGSGQ